jgi:hypothetical protein
MLFLARTTMLYTPFEDRLWQAQQGRDDRSADRI